MNWFALVDGKLVCIGNCGDWEAAYEVACDAIGEVEWTWLINEIDARQWVHCITNNSAVRR
tara:strand:+ start:346 stop:528 length:183 start_codon:yes stop_codon:yes gene_type:complete